MMPTSDDLPTGRLALFGASAAGRRGLEQLRTAGVEVECFLDNDAARWGKVVDGVEVRAPRPDVLERLDVIWVTSMYAAEIGRQLEAEGVAARLAWTLDDVLLRVAPRLSAARLRLRSDSVPDVALVVADEGWILERCARALEERLPYTRVSTEPIPGARVTYYLNYSAWRAKASPLEMAFFTHVEEAVPAAASRFFAVARRMDVAIAMSARYADRLRAEGAGDVRLITPGVDLDRFQPRVKIGVVGRTYQTGRKGEALVRAVLDEPHVEWHFTGEGWPGPARHLTDDELPAFYRSMDYILVPSLYEGGPMPVLEALASGIEVIAPRVGFVDDYPHIEFEAGDAADLRRVVRDVVQARLSRRRTVEARTWDAWAAQHDVVFRELLARAQAAPARPSTVVVRRPADRLRVLLALHAPEAEGGTGGPSIRVPRMREALSAHGIDADVSTAALPDTSGYDIVHTFNVWEPAAAERQLRHLRSTGVPVVFSPILLDLYESLWAQRTIVPLFRAARPEAETSAELHRLSETPHALRQALGAALSPFWETWPQTVRTLASLADHLVVLSEHERALLNRAGALAVPASLVHNGVDLAFGDDVGGDLFRSHVGTGDYVLCVGRVEPRKNQLLLAWALRGTGIDLVLVGDTPKEDYAELVRAAHPGHVHTVGRVPHHDPLLASAYAGARVFALPSWSEGMPLAALEAAACGLPLVLSDRSGEREYLGPLASYCDPGRADDLRQRLLEAWNGGGDRAARRAEARAWIARALTWDHAARETARVYERVMQGRQRPTAFRSPPPRRLEIGSGMAPQPGYEHLDARPDLPDIDHVADIRRPLPFPDGTFDEVMSRSCIEHVSWRDVRDVLREWGRILKPGGRLDIWTPDFEYLCRRYLARLDDRHLHPTLVEEAGTYLGGYDAAAWAMIKMFGGQDYAENFHGAVLDEDVLTRVLEAAGFERVERHEPYWGLHLVAHRSPSFAPRPTGEAVTTRTPSAEVAVPSLTWDGPLFNVSGYASLGRHVVRALTADGVAVQIRSRDDEAAVREACLSGPDAAIWRRGLRKRGGPRVHVACYTPADWKGDSIFRQRKAEAPGYAAYVGLSMFETDRLPDGWALACNELDEVWVPSQFARERFVEGGVEPGKVQVMPVGIDADRYDPNRVSPLPIAGCRGFTFLSVFDWTLRKGWDVLLEAYATAFRASDDVCLVLRTASRSARDVPADAIDAVFDRLGIPSGDRPTVLVVDAPLADEDMPRLYRAADAFVLPTRGEGWGLTLMEAMAAGLPAIATRWGGHLDFMSDANAWLIDVDALVEVPAAQVERSPFYAGGHRWAQPSIVHTAALMRRAFESREACSRLGAAARRDILSTWTPGRTTAWVRHRLAALAVDPQVALERARLADARGAHEEALSLYATAAQGPGGTVAAYNRASLLKRLQRRGEAQHAFRALSRARDRGLRAGALFHLGELAAIGGRWDDADALFAQCLDLSPGHARARAWQAMSAGRRHRDNGASHDALAAFEAAVGLQPGWWLALYNLASAAEAVGDPVRAATLFERICAEADDAALRAGAHYHLARLHERGGRPAEAAGHLESCLLEAPDHEGARRLRDRLVARLA